MSPETQPINHIDRLNELIEKLSVIRFSIATMIHETRSDVVATHLDRAETNLDLCEDAIDEAIEELENNNP